MPPLDLASHHKVWYFQVWWRDNRKVCSVKVFQHISTQHISTLRIILLICFGCQMRIGLLKSSKSRQTYMLVWNWAQAVCEFCSYISWASCLWPLMEIPPLTQAIPGCLKRWVDSRRDPARATVGKGVYSQVGEGLSPLMHSHTLIGGQSCPGEIPPTRQLCKKRPGLGNKEPGFMFDLEKGFLYVK